MLKPPFRADHVGSLLRPNELAKKRQEWRDERIPLEVLRDLEDEHISKAIKLQEEIGLKAITDGEVSIEEQEKAQQKADFSRCKKETENILGGILFANPKVYMISVKSLIEGSAKSVVMVYVQSMVDQSQIMRYRFVL